jgi:hypothetical protein
MPRYQFPMLSVGFLIDIILLVDSASNRNEYQEYFLQVKGGQCLGLIILQPLCADCLKIWESQPPGTLTEPVIGLYKDCFTCFVHMAVEIWSDFCGG